MTELSKEHARSFFSAQGFTVEDIPTAEALGEQRADLRVSSDGDEYIVEAKAREPHCEWPATMQRAETDGFASISRDIEPWSLLGNGFQRPTHNLLRRPLRPTHSGCFGSLPFMVGDADFVISCFEKQLIGVRQVFAFRPELFSHDGGGAPDARLCYYYEDSDFERYPKIDAAMLCTPKGGQLFVNQFSPNRERFRGTRLYSVVNNCGALVDAEIRVRNGQALMLDTDFCGPRGDGAQQTYLREKHGVLVNLAMESHLHMAAVLPVARAERFEEATTSAPEGAPKEEDGR